MVAVFEIVFLIVCVLLGLLWFRRTISTELTKGRESIRVSLGAPRRRAFHLTRALGEEASGDEQSDRVIG